MATPHNSAANGDFAKTVLMPGDPLRAKLIAEHFLTDTRMVNNVRGIHGYTGKYEGVPVSVMASGMGMPSMGIYSYELYREYGVQNILRIGSAGALSADIALRDLVIGMGACTNSNYAAQYGLPGTFAPIASYDMLTKTVAAAEAAGVRCHVGNLLSSDTFYSDNASRENENWRKMGVLAVEMEAAALYMNAARLGRNALAICTISDSLVHEKALSALERQNSFTEMIGIALRVAVELYA